MKQLLYKLESSARAFRFWMTRRVPVQDITLLWPGIETSEVRLRPFLSQFGNVSRYELMVLCSVAKHSRAKSLFEFGTFDGLTTWHLAANCGSDAKVWTVDLPLDHPARTSCGYDQTVGRIQGIQVGKHFRETEQCRQIEQLLVDSQQFQPGALTGTMDFCFVDAGHDYEHVVADSQSALAMMRPGGVIFWHDYSRWWPGVQAALDGLSVKYPLVQVPNTSLVALRTGAVNSGQAWTTQ